jgi:hypothetical protein
MVGNAVLQHSKLWCCFRATGVFATAAAVSFGVAAMAPDALQLGLQRDWLWELLPDAACTAEPWPREQGATCIHLCRPPMEPVKRLLWRRTP